MASITRRGTLSGTTVGTIQRDRSSGLMADTTTAENLWGLTVSIIQLAISQESMAITILGVHLLVLTANTMKPVLTWDPTVDTTRRVHSSAQTGDITRQVPSWVRMAIIIFLGIFSVVTVSITLVAHFLACSAVMWSRKVPPNVIGAIKKGWSVSPRSTG